jgi:hypothetical protein
MWNNAPPRFLQFQKSSSTIPAFFRGYFVNFNLFNVIFAQFLNFYNFQCESKKKGKEKGKNIVKVNVCVFCICFMDVFILFYDKTTKTKEEFNILI